MTRLLTRSLIVGLKTILWRPDSNTHLKQFNLISRRLESNWSLNQKQASTLGKSPLFLKFYSIFTVSSLLTCSRRIYYQRCHCREKTCFYLHLHFSVLNNIPSNSNFNFDLLIKYEAFSIWVKQILRI